MVALRWDEIGGVDQIDGDDRDDRLGQRSSRPRLYVSPEGPRRPGRRRSAPVYGRRGQRRWRFAVRRALVVVIIASLGALAWSVAERLVAVASTGGGNPAACPTVRLSCPGTQAYVAAPGDSVWSIALRFSHGGDPRPLADQLEAEIGDGVLQPGQKLAVP